MEKRQKVQISMDPELMQLLDQYAARHYTSRSGAVAQAVSQMVNTERALLALDSLRRAMDRIVELDGNIDPETERELEVFQRYAERVISAAGQR